MSTVITIPVTNCGNCPYCYQDSYEDQVGPLECKYLDRYLDNLHYSEDTMRSIVPYYYAIADECPFRKENS